MARGKPGQCEATSLSARQHSDALEDVLASEEKARQMVASLGVVHSAGHLHRVEHGVVATQLKLRLREETHARGRRGLNETLERGEIADERAHQRGLPCAIRSDNRDAGIPGDTQHPGANERLAVPDRERSRLHDRVSGQMGCLEAPAVPLCVLRRLDAFDSRELLSSAARFL